MSTPNLPPVTPLPMFATTGWTTSLAEKADGLLSHFFESDYYQTNLYAGNVSNLQWLIQQYGNNIVSLLSQTRSTLEQYLNRYYPTVMVTVTSNGTDPTFTGDELTLTIAIQVTENNQVQSFGYLVSSTNSIINKIARINNTGAPI